MDAEAIRTSLVSGRYRVTLHARQRMGERIISDSDISHCASVATRVNEQDDGKFRVTGPDLDGDELTLICAWDGETVIVTLF
jgi:hypothetical protein